MNNRILCCDDDANVLAGFQRNLRKRFALDVAASGADAIQTIERDGPYAVVVADMQMPAMNGIELLMKIEQRWPDTVRLMLTGNADQQTAVDAVNHGHVFRFLNKPCSPETLGFALEAGLKQNRLIRAEKELLEQTLNGAIAVFSEILSLVDPHASGRGRTLRDHMRAFMESLGQPCGWECEVAAMLAPIGYVTIPQDVLQRARTGLHLSGAEKDVIARVPETGQRLLAKIPRLERISEIILYQQKNFDGTGLPADGLTGEEIPVASRILRVLGELHEREARGQSRGEALLAMQENPGCYDPRVLDAAFKCFDIYLPASSAADASERVSIADLRPGHILLSDIETTEGMLLLNRGCKLTLVLLEKIRNFERLNEIKQPVVVGTVG